MCVRARVCVCVTRQTSVCLCHVTGHGKEQTVGLGTCSEIYLKGRVREGEAESHNFQVFLIVPDV